jgi:peptide/nickel transport system substrate-binding protein
VPTDRTSPVPIAIVTTNEAMTASSESNDSLDRGVRVGNTYNRRQFLAQSAATAGGVVIATTLADEIGIQPAWAGGLETLNVGVISEQNKPFTPDWGTLDTTGFMIARAIYDPLCVVSSDGMTVYPYLAESVTPNAGYDVWTIKARATQIGTSDPIKFHNGQLCNGDAIYANLEADYTSLLTGTALKGLIEDIDHKKGSNTVTVKTKFKWVTFPYTLAEQQIGFMAAPATLGADGKEPPLNENPQGTGPFIVTSWVYNSEFKTTRNANYWRAPGVLPHLGGINFYPVPDSGSRLDGLTGGNYDMIIETDPKTIKSMSTLGSGYNISTDLASAPGGYTPVYNPSVGCVMLNLREAPFNNANMRKGCAYALDLPQFVGVIDKGLSSPVDGIYLPTSPYYKHPTYPTYDTTTAKKYIAKVPASKRSMQLQYVEDDPTILDAAEYVAAAFKKVGCKVTLKAVAQGTLIDNAISHSFEAMLWSQFGGVSPDLNYPWFSTKSGPLNFAGNFDATIQADMQAGMGATTLAKREAAWGSVNNKIDVDIPYLWLDRSVNCLAATTNVGNWTSATDPVGNPVLQPNQGVLFWAEVTKS